MSEPASSAVPRSRPASVSAAGGLLYLYAALQLVSAVLVLLTLSDMRRAMSRAYQGTDFAGQSSVLATVGSVVGVGAAVLFAAGAIVLAILDLRGKNAARIVTWVFGGLGVCCAGYGLVSVIVGATVNFGGRGPSGGPSASEIQRILRESLPGWYYPANITLGLLELLTLILVVVLLAVPSANRFFRRQPAVWEPPLPPTPAR